MKRNTLICLLLAILFSPVLRAQVPQLKLIPYISSGLVKPVDITHCGDSRVFIVEQDGRIRIVQNGVLQSLPFLDINPQVNSTGNEQGLLGLAFHPDYKSNGYFYINYTNNSGNTVVSRFSVNPSDSNRALAGSELILLTVTQPYSNHNGGDLLFGPDGYLYIPLGDGGSAGDPQNFAQNKKSRLGKTLRIDVNYGSLFAIPPDNPFLNDTTFLPELWHIGLRNPWRCSFDPANGNLWLGDVGQGAFEEVDLSRAGSGGGENYGWRCYEANNPYNTNGCQPLTAYVSPVYSYPHISGGQCSVTGGEVYRGALSLNFFGHYIFSDFCTPTLRTLREDNTGAFIHQLNTAWPGAGISAFGSDYYGELYVANLYNGQVRKIADTSSCIPVAWLASTDTLRVCDTIYTLRTPLNDSISYAWYLDNTLLPGISGNTCTATLDGTYRVEVVNLRNGCTNTASVVLRLLGAQPAVSITGLDTAYCISNGPVLLSGSPAGGVFSGLGLSGNSFTPQAAGLGTVLVRYDYTDTTNGCVNTKILPVRIKVCTSADELSPLISGSRVFPNPAQREARIDFTLAESRRVRMELLDPSGRMVQFVEMQLPAGPQQMLLPLKGLASGMYMLRLSPEQDVPVVHRLVVKP